MKNALKFWTLTLGIMIIGSLGILAMILLRIVSLVLFPNTITAIIYRVNAGVHRFIDWCEKVEQREKKRVKQPIKKKVDPAVEYFAKKVSELGTAPAKNKKFRVEFLSAGGRSLWTWTGKEHCRACAINMASKDALKQNVVFDAPPSHARVSNVVDSEVEHENV